MSNNKGFSLLEVLVATVVITTIMGVVVTKFQNNVGDSKVQKAMLELKTVKNAQAQYYRKNKAYPVNIFTGSVSNIDTKLGKWTDGNMKATWLAGCEDSNVVNKTKGAFVGMHHITDDLMLKLIPEFQKVCPLGSATLNADPVYANYIYCRTKPVSQISTAAGVTAVCN